MRPHGRFGMINLFGSAYKGKRVLVTGHTGFKGTWLTFWLEKLGAEVYGISLSPDTTPSHFELLKTTVDSEYIDITNYESLEKKVKAIKPDIVFHLAAQSLVRKSYIKPIETFTTNIIGTANLFEVCRKISSVQAIINITSDKCYENKEWLWGYRENDPIGGFDPYSVSKACAELITTCYRNSYFSNTVNCQILLSSCRAGNVIGGGDWSEDRLIPDVVRSTIKKSVTTIRSPSATRPWQHVLEPLSGYLLLGQKLLEGQSTFADSWNFGPDDSGNLTVLQTLKLMQKYWPEINYEIDDTDQPHEAGFLKLDCSKANTLLKWNGVWKSNSAFEYTMSWYLSYYKHNEIVTEKQLKKYVSDARHANLSWTN